MHTSEVCAVTQQVWTAVLIKPEAYLFHQIQMTQLPEKDVDLSSIGLSIFRPSLVRGRCDSQKKKKR